MIMPIAIAKDGFITTRFPNVENLEEFLKTLPFEDKDLQFFDGNTCRIINDYDPTNSIFIYENQQGEFLYTITSATPLIHKNNKIWLCNCYEMENLTEYKNDYKKFDQQIYRQELMEKGQYSTMTNYPIKIRVKDNFETLQTYKANLNYGLSFFTLKIKCSTNPTTLDLKTNAPDGSFNFLFPIYISKSANGIEQMSTTITDSLALTKVVSLYDVISKYLPNIKSIELLPFRVSKIGDENIGFDIIENDDETYTVYNQGVTFTDCGFFVKTNYSYDYNDLDIDYSLLPNFDAKALVFGGGIRGFLQTPLGNIQLEFNSEKFDELAVGSYLIKEDGWKIDGKFKCDVPPIYLNFYTDNAGQLFIQNLTTNAQELRQINNEKIYKEESNQINFINQTLKNATGIVSSAISGNFTGALSGIGAIANNLVESEFNKSQIEREYNKSLAEFRDKEKTQSLLASMTGRELSGQFSLVDFLESVNGKYFCLFFETNYRKIQNNYICQPNYDYSIETWGNLRFNYDEVQSGFWYPINYLLSFRKFGIYLNNNNQIETTTSKKINIFVRNAINRNP